MHSNLDDIMARIFCDLYLTARIREPIAEDPNERAKIRVEFE